MTTFLKILTYPTLRSMIISQSSRQKLSRHTKRVLQAMPPTPNTKKVWIPEDARYIKYIAVGIASSDYAEINAARNERRR